MCELSVRYLKYLNIRVTLYQRSNKAAAPICIFLHGAKDGYIGAVITVAQGMVYIYGFSKKRRASAARFDDV
jgi:hypothetical protein